MTFCVCILHEYHTPFLGRFIFIMEVLPSNFIVVSIFVNVFTKGLLLTSTTPTLPILMAEIAVLLVLDIRLPASRRISMQNQFLMMDG